MSSSSISLPAIPESAVAARRFLRTEGRLDKRRQAKADVLITELIANVIAHSGRVLEFTIDLERSQTLGLLVTVSHEHPAALGDVEPGFGFLLMERLARSWGHHHEDGKLAVWFRIPTPGTHNPLSRLSDEELFGLMDEEPELCSDELLRRHSDLASAIAKRYFGKGVDSDDLLQVARMSLLKAIQRYDSSRGDLRHYAASSISGELKNLFRDTAWAVRVPRRLKEDALEVGRAAEELSRTLMREPEVDEIADHLGIGVSRAANALNARNAYNSISANQPKDGDDSALIDRFEDDDLRMLSAEDRVTLERCVATLPARQRDIIHLRYNEDLTQSEIAERLGISQMHVSRLLKRSIEEIRQLLVG